MLNIFVCFLEITNKCKLFSCLSLMRKNKKTKFLQFFYSCEWRNLAETSSCELDGIVHVQHLGKCWWLHWTKRLKTDSLRNTVHHKWIRCPKTFFHHCNLQLHGSRDQQQPRGSTMISVFRQTLFLLLHLWHRTRQCFVPDRAARSLFQVVAS